MSLVPGRLTCLSLWKKMQPTNNCIGAPPPPLLNALPPAMGNDPSRFIIGGVVQGEAMVYIFLILSTIFLLLLLYSQGHALWFCYFFVFNPYFCHGCGKDETKGLE